MLVVDAGGISGNTGTSSLTWLRGNVVEVRLYASKGVPVTSVTVASSMMP
jgi:hypothetical protein